MPRLWIVKPFLLSVCGMVARTIAMAVLLCVVYSATEARAEQICVLVPENTPLYIQATGSAVSGGQDKDQDYYVTSRVGNRLAIRYSYFDVYVNIRDVKVADCTTGRVIQSDSSPQIKFVSNILNNAAAVVGSSAVRLASAAFGLVLFVLLLLRQATKRDIAARDTLWAIVVIAAAEVCFSGFIGQFPSLVMGFGNLLISVFIVRAACAPKNFTDTNWLYDSDDGQWYGKQALDKAMSLPFRPQRSEAMSLIFHPQRSALMGESNRIKATLRTWELIFPNITYVSLAFFYFHGHPIFHSISSYLLAMGKPLPFEPITFAQEFASVGGLLFMIISFVVMFLSCAVVWFLWPFLLIPIIGEGFAFATDLRNRNNFPAIHRPPEIHVDRTKHQTQAGQSQRKGRVGG